MKTILDGAKALKEQLVQYRRYLHAHAEVGFDLPQTFAFVMDTLHQLGYQPKKVGRCGMVATLGKGEPAVMLRADMDALPLKEESGLSFACQSGNTHACGHDLHTAMLLGAAALLKQEEASLEGSIIFLFQPAEELLSGAADMLESGLLTEYHPQSAMMLHVMNTSGMQPGTVVVPPEGVSAPAADMFEICIQGKGCHGAMPHHGIDSINVGAHLVLALQAISTREMSLHDAHALTIASFQAGETTNVMQDHALLKGSVRSYDMKTQSFLRKRIGEVTTATAQTFRAGAKVHWLSGCPTLVNDEKLVQQAREQLPGLIGAERVLSAAELGGNAARSVGSEDFSYISQQVPSLMLAMAAGGESELPLHHPKIVFNEDALPYGAAVYAAYARWQLGETKIK